MNLAVIDRDLVAGSWTASEAYANLETLCDFGSRFAGTPGELLARDFIAERFQAYGLANVRSEPFEYTGWWRGPCAVHLVAPRDQPLDAISLVYSPSTPEGGLRAPVVDVGMGTEEEYARHAGALAGRLVLCSSANPEEGRSPHRREKYGRAVAAGAAGFIYSRHLPGGLPETGSLRPGRLGEIPAVAVSYETGCTLKRLVAKGETVVSLTVQNESHPATAYHVLGEIPGQTGEIVVAGGHYDGQDISQGAMDDATGVCLTLELARLFGPLAGQVRRTVRLMGFPCEELGVLGSTRYVAAHRQEMAGIAIMMNLDNAVGSGPKGFTYSGMDDIAATLRAIAKETGYALRLRDRVGTASDNFPFFMEGVPAIAMTARENDRALGRGFGHTAMDTLDKVDDRDLRECAMVAARVLLRLADREEIGRHRTPSEIRDILIAQDLEAPLRAQDKWPFP